jgi:DNA-binding beta-propeller fold protein YncE
MRCQRVLVTIALVGWSCKTGPTPLRTTAPSPRAVRSVALPGAPSGGVLMDYLAYDRVHHRVWVPAGNTGSVDVVDTASGRVTQIVGFATAEVERRGIKRTVGPSSATVGDGVVFIGNRADSSICAVNAVSLDKAGCITLDSTPDGLAYVAATREVWVTTPRTKSVTILDATAGALTNRKSMTLDGAPEGYAVDSARGIFYTNLEDKDRTLTLDVWSKKVTGNWPAGCGKDGPKGLAVDRSLNFVFLACSDHVKLLDARHDGKERSAIDTGAGVDDIAYLEARRELYVGAAKAAKLTIASLDARGRLAVEATIATAPGARNAVVTDEGVAYLTDSAEGKLLVVSPHRGNP